MRRGRGLIGLGALLALIAAAPAGDWPFYGRTAGGDRHAPIAQITPANVSTLAIAWRFSTGELKEGVQTTKPVRLSATPIMVDGRLFLNTPLGRVFALDPVTGRMLWRFDARIDHQTPYGDFVSRGVSYWRDRAAAPGARCAARIIAPIIDARLIALDAADGRPCAGFGAAGAVDLRRGLRNAPEEMAEYELTSPPAIIGDVIVAGSGVADNSRTEGASGEVRGFDARTGKLIWTFDPVPQDRADPAHATWTGERAHHTGAANVWSVIAADAALGLVYLPTTSPSPDYYGGGRLGANAYASSIVALEARTGRRRWAFQTVHHDLWDYDNAAPPALVTIRKGGREVPALLQATKSGQLFALDRRTGVPIWPVTEMPAPASDVSGEQAFATQPVSSLPALSPMGVSAEDMWGPDADARAGCAAWAAALRNDGPFTPPSLKGSLVRPSNIGGAQWGGLTYDPARNIAVAPVNTLASVVTLIPEAEAEAARKADSDGQRLGLEYTRMRGTPYVMKRVFFARDGMPCTKPPFGMLHAIDMGTGRTAWAAPLGSTEGVPGMPQPAAGAPPTGMVTLGGPISTASGLTFIGSSPDRFFRAFETASGRELWKARLPAGARATPMTYVGGDGRQYVVIAAGGDGDFYGRGDEFIAFALPGASSEAGR